MTDRAKLLELAERCETAAGPDRGLEDDIAIELGWSRYADICSDDVVDYGWISPDKRSHAWHPFWTRSTDAALTLAPEGHSIRLWLHTGENHADVYQLGDLIETPSGLDRPLIGFSHEGHAATPALAICAAALRAMAETAPAPIPAQPGAAES